MNQDFTPEQLKVIDRIQKLLNLAAKNDNPNEAASALAKAQAMLAEHNLDSAVLETAGKAADGKREEAKVEGGTYSFQRELWEAVAKLNFCIYWSQKFRTEDKVRQNVYERDPETGENKYAGKKYVQVRRRRHALIGRTVNTRMTIAMATYLQDAIERGLSETLSQRDDLQRHSNWAWSFRKGVASTIVDKLRDRRRENIARDEKEARKAASMAKKAGEHSTARGLTISTFAKAEEDANNDVRFGEGYSAKAAARRAKDAARSAAMEQAYTRWAEANPKAARSSFEFIDDEGSTWSYGRPSYSGGTRGTSSENIDYGAYRAGREFGEKIGLDPQAESRGGAQGRIGR